jgi:hypothetical protein
MQAIPLLVFVALAVAQDYFVSHSTLSDMIRVLPGASVSVEFYLSSSDVSDANAVSKLVWRDKGVFFASESATESSIQDITATEVAGGWQFSGSWKAPRRECKQFVELVVSNSNGQPVLRNGKKVVFARTIVVTCSNGVCNVFSQLTCKACTVMDKNAGLVRGVSQVLLHGKLSFLLVLMFSVTTRILAQWTLVSRLSVGTVSGLLTKRSKVARRAEKTSALELVEPVNVVMTVVTELADYVETVMFATMPVNVSQLLEAEVSELVPTQSPC